MSDTELSRVRLDKWLWAARFFKTRTLAKQAIEGGKVRIAGGRTKVSKEIAVGDTLQIRQGYDDVTVVVTALAARRGPASQARKLYAETPQSAADRERRAAERRAARTATGPPTPGRPTKKQRRLIHRFKRDRPG